MTRTRVLFPVLLLVLVAGSCTYLESPIPGFLSGVTEHVHLDLNEIIADPSAGVRYELDVIGSGESRRLVLLASPTVSDPSATAYRDRLLVMDPAMREERRLQPDSRIDYLSRPFGYGHDGDLLVGYAVYDADGTTPRLEIDPRHGLEGFIVVDEALPSTHLFANPSGRFSSYHLEIRNYFLSDWSVQPDAEAVDIVPGGRALSDDPAREQLGFQLLGVVRDGAHVLFLFSQPAEQLVVGARAPLGAIRDGTVSALRPEGESWLFTIPADRPQADVDGEGFFLMRRDGWFVRYDWDGDVVARVTGDTSFSRRYAFDLEGNAFYRFDAETRTLTRIEGWW